MYQLLFSMKNVFEVMRRLVEVPAFAKPRHFSSESDRLDLCKPTFFSHTQQRAQT